MRHSAEARRSAKSRLPNPGQQLRLENLEDRLYPGNVLAALGWSAFGASLLPGRDGPAAALRRTEGVAHLSLVSQDRASPPAAARTLPVPGTTDATGRPAPSTHARDVVHNAADFPSWQSEFDLFGDDIQNVRPRRGPVVTLPEGLKGVGDLPLGGSSGGAAPGASAPISPATPSPASARAADEPAASAMLNGVVGTPPATSAARAAAPGRPVPAAVPATDPATEAPVQAAATGASSVPQGTNRLPLDFETNRGQTDAQVRFLAQAPGYSLFLTPTEAVLAFPKPAQVAATEVNVVRMQLLGANPAAAVVGRDELAGKSNYFLGNDPSRWVTDVPHYASAVYQGVYPGIDLVYYGTQDHQLEYDWKVAPGADPSAIHLNFAGAAGLSLDAQDNLVVHTADGDLVQHAPVLYQDVNGGKQAVAGGYVLQGGNQVGFAVGSHDAGRPLVIDPVMNYATHLGGGQDDSAAGVAVDRTGATYVTGRTTSVDFPTTPGAFQTTLRSADAFVAKLNADGTDLAYATYLGSPGEDAGTAIAVDAAGNAYVAGTTNSAAFPTTASAFQRTYGGGGDGFVAKLNATGSALVYASYLGGRGLDSADGLTLDVAGSAYVVGQTMSADFPTTPGAYQRTLQGASDAVVAKVQPDGSALAYATFLGGTGAEAGKGIAVDGAGNAYVVGDTSGNFPVTSGAAQTTFGGGVQDTFVARLNAAGASLGYATYLGGNNREDSAAITVDAAGSAYVTSQTASANFPTTSSAFQKAYGGGGDSFVAKLNPAGSAWVYATFLGGSGAELGTALAVDPTTGTVTVVGSRPIYYIEYDNLNEAVAQERYDGDGITVSIGSDGVPVNPPADLLRARSTTDYDNQGRVFRTSTLDVDQTSGDVSAAGLTANTFYNHNGEVIATTAPGGLATKYQYDGAGRVVTTFVTDAGGNTTWARAGAVASDTVLTQTETQYDADGNPLLVTTKERFHDEKAAGALSDPSGGARGRQPKARDSFTAFYYDAADRLTAAAAVGTNGGAAYTHPPTVPDRSDAVLVTGRTYNAAGWVQDVTDPRGLVTHADYDNLGRTTRTIAAYTDGVPTSNTDATTTYTYDGAGHVLTQTAVLPNGLHQTTQYVYNARTANGDAVNSNDLLSAMLYPDKTTGDPSDTEAEVYTSNALGQRTSMTDRNGTQHAYAYDVLGRPTSDTVTTLGAGVDGQVQRLETAYDTGGRPSLYTSLDAPGGNVVNQVAQVYNGLSQLVTEYQSHAGPVDPTSTPSVQYVYSELSNGANHSRLEQMIYPNGRTLNYNYSAGLNDRISRVSSLDDGTTILETYAYLGLDTVVQRHHPQTGVDLTYVAQAGEPNGDAGDPYTGLDRFGRVVDQRWLNPSSGNTTDRFQYGYDRDGNPLYRDNLVNPAFGELYHAGGTGNGYDPLNRLTDFGRGTLNDTHDDLVGGPSHSQSWTLDATGNWQTLTTDGVASSRDHNAQNQIGDIDGSPLAYDNNGNLIADQTGQVYVYDAWNRLVQVQDAGGNLLAAYSYDALGRRIVETTDVTRDLYFSAAGQVLEEQVGGATTIQYVWSPVAADTLVLRDRDPSGSGTLSERLYAQQDAAGNVTALVDPTGTVVERYVYDPYGLPTVLDADGNAQDPAIFGWKYLYQDGRYELATGLYTLHGRDYSPTLGRWMQQDPMGYMQGMNLYQHAGGSPVATPAGAEGKYGRIKVQFHWDREGKGDANAAADAIRAWKDPDYRASLSAAELAALPAHPAGGMAWNPVEWGGDGGTAIWISAGGQCGSYGNIICGQSYGWCPNPTVSIARPCKIQWGRMAKSDTAAPVDVVRAWKDPDYRSSLSAADLAALPEHPAGGMAWNPVEWDGGGTAKWISVGGQCGSFGNVICGQSYGWCPNPTVSAARPCHIEWK